MTWGDRVGRTAHGSAIDAVYDDGRLEVRTEDAELFACWR
jgi:hypothetical protein